jgi:diaminohydroxyphosphoribosylaminopyrimidine deaminase/5-amino-6-(5-phosphoribosylamino)uracil reductase
MVVDDNFFMALAVNEAWKYQGLTYPNPAVGCCVVKDGAILGVNAHQRAGEPHAEVLALRDSYLKLTNDTNIKKLSSSQDIHNYLLQNHNGCFHGCFVYTTLEPCSHMGKTPSCASLISALGVKKVFVGFRDINKEASDGNSILKSSNIDVVEGTLQKECEDLIAPFNKWQKKNFVFFKWAQRLDGSIDGGTISSKTSRTNVHAMRDVCDLLVIGGNTVRLDRPTLDARFVYGKAPDVLIISQQKEFDKTIPLFHVEGREVFIQSDFSKLSEYKNIMIEGGLQMFELSKDVVDYYLCYVAFKMGGGHTFGKSVQNFELLNIQKETQDIIMWMKRKI